MEKKLLIIPSDMLPIPPVKGGAVQNLIEFFIDWNEKNKKYKLTVISIYDCEAEKKAMQYTWCEFIYVKFPFDVEKKRNSKNKILNSIFYRVTDYLYLNKIKRTLIDNEYDLIIFDNTPQYIRHVVDENIKAIVHIYNDYLNKDTLFLEETLKNIKTVVTVSDYISNIVKEAYSNVNVKTLYNGVEIQRFSCEKERKEELSNKFKSNSETVVLLFVARLVQEKGPRELLKAYSMLKQNQNIHLLVVGDRFYSGNTKDEYYEELLQIADTCKNKVSFTGYVPYNELDDYYRLADIGVLPTVWDEPFSMAAIEYMASGLAVIVSNAGGFPEMVGNAGIVIDRGENFIKQLSESLQLLIDDAKLRDNLGTLAKERAEKFSKENYCIGLEKIVQEEIG